MDPRGEGAGVTTGLGNSSSSLSEVNMTGVSYQNNNHMVNNINRQDYPQHFTIDDYPDFVFQVIKRID